MRSLLKRWLTRQDECSFFFVQGRWISMLRLKTSHLMVALVGAIILGAPPPAQAAFKLRITDGKETKFVEDTDGDGFINYNGSIGSFNIVVTTGVSKPAIGNQYMADMDVTSLAVTSGPLGGTLTIDMTDTGFDIVPGNNDSAILTSSIAGNISAGGSVTFQSWVGFGAGNQEFIGLDSSSGTVVTTGLQGPLTGNAFASSVSKEFTLSPQPFAMTSRTVIVLTGNGTFSSTDGRTTVITPAPAVGVLALSAAPVLFAGLFFRRRLRKS